MPGDFIGLDAASEAVKEPGVVGRELSDAARPMFGCVAMPPCTISACHKHRDTHFATQVCAKPSSQGNMYTAAALMQPC